MSPSISVLMSQALSQIKLTITPQAIQFLIYISPIALCLMLGVIFWDVWMRYVHGKFYHSLKYCVLEIRLPRDMFKSPLAMESFLNSIHNTSDGGWYTQLWKGEYRPYYSLELVSIEGVIKYFIWCEDRRKGGVMSALYSQFPGIEVHETEDYTKSIHFDPGKIRIWAAEFKFTKEDPYPIKTYVDYGLDKDPKEEFKVDPLLPMIEFMGSIKPNQQVWIQILIKAHKDDQRHPKYFWKRTDLWKDKAQELVNKILIRDALTKTAGGEPDPETGYTKVPIISKGEQNIVEAIERSVTKLAFDAGIRGLYISPNDTFDTPFGIGGIIGNMKQFNTEHLNGFRPNGDKWHNHNFDYPWQDFRNIRRNRMGRRALLAYKLRSYFYPPFVSKPLVLNTEELATIYHFPGAIAMTPTLERIPSKKSTAPMNLPV